MVHLSYFILPATLIFCTVDAMECTYASRVQRSEIPTLCNSLSIIFDELALGNSPQRAISCWSEEMLKLLKKGANINDLDEEGKNILHHFLCWLLKEENQDLDFDVESILDNLFLGQGATFINYEGLLQEIVSSRALTKSPALRKVILWLITNNFPVPPMSQTVLTPCLRVHSLLQLITNGEEEFIASLQAIQFLSDLFFREPQTGVLAMLLDQIEASYSERERVISIALPVHEIITHNETLFGRLTPISFLSQLLAPSMVPFLSGVLEMAAGRGHIRIADYIVNTLAQGHELYWLNPRVLTRAMTRSAAAGHLDVTTLLMQRLTNTPLSFDEPFLLAAGRAHVDTLIYFLMNRAALITDNAVEEALLIASRQNNLTVIQAIVGYRRTFDTCFWKRVIESCLKLASIRLNKHVFSFLLKFDREEGFIIDTRSIATIMHELSQDTNLPRNMRIQYANFVTQLNRHKPNPPSSIDFLSRILKSIQPTIEHS